MWLSLKEWPFSNLMNLLMMEKEPCERLQNKSPNYYKNMIYLQCLLIFLINLPSCHFGIFIHQVSSKKLKVLLRKFS